MKLIDKDFVTEYAKNDWIAREMSCSTDEDSRLYKSQQWLKESVAKRAVFQECYGVLCATRGKRVLDVGGGLTSFTGRWASDHFYTLMDPLFHQAEHIDLLTSRYPKCGLLLNDWREDVEDSWYDIVIANDVFPNVDQGIDRFIADHTSNCAQLRMSITWHNGDRYYRARRIDAEEVLTVVPWTGEQVAACLEKYKKNIYNYNPELFSYESQSAFPNGRSVVAVTFIF